MGYNVNRVGTGCAMHYQGKYTVDVASWILHGISFSMLHNCFTLTEMMILKCLYLFFWPRMAMLEDTLVAKLCGLFNLMISSMCTFTRLHLGEYHTNPHFLFATGHEFFKDESDLSQKTHFM
jgi:hypothetical protein